MHEEDGYTPLDTNDAMSLALVSLKQRALEKFEAIVQEECQRKPT